MNRTIALMLTVSATALLGACGGGHSVADEAQATVPDAALASPQAYTDYVASLPATETDEPVNVDKVSVAPSSDTTEPVALN